MLGDSRRGVGTAALTAPRSADSLIPGAPARADRDLNADAMFEKSILVVAHPDDEVLWFSSILNRVERILVCFIDAPPPNHTSSVGRRRVIFEYPVKTILALDIPEPGLLGAANWNNPVVTEFGLKVRRKASERSERSFHTLRELLRPQLAPYRNVFTHNPWGEYGNEEHVQLFHVINSLKQKLEFDLWFSNYCSNISYRLMMQYTCAYASRYITLETNLALVENITRLYQQHACWTWYDDWEPFRNESFLGSSSLTFAVDSPDRERASPLGFLKHARGRGHLFPLNFMRLPRARRHLLPLSFGRLEF